MSHCGILVAWLRFIRLKRAFRHGPKPPAFLSPGGAAEFSPRRQPWVWKAGPPRRSAPAGAKEPRAGTPLSPLPGLTIWYLPNPTACAVG